MDLAKNPNLKMVPPELSRENPLWLTEPQLKKLAHLPLLALFYLFFQKKVSSTPVTALELAAYLGVDVQLSEVLLLHLEKKATVKVFKEGIPAYSLRKDLDHVTLKDLMELVWVIQEWSRKEGHPLPGPSTDESQEKYRKIYSALASEMLQLFGEEAANKIPV